jgi:hypothetical protein
MKRPDLSKLKPKPKPKRAAKPRAQIKAPQFVEDLYRDMRDRRLLLPALALIIAIVAVPVALSASKEPAPAPVAAVPPEGAEAVAPAVLAETPGGIRDYRERLDELKSKNPFESAAAEAAAATSGDPADVIVTPSGDPASSTSTSTATSTSTTSPTDTSLPTDDPAPPSGGGDDEPKPEILVAQPRLDVEAGRAGEARLIDDVKPGDLLPSKREAPIAMFLEASANLKFAHFAISENVSRATGQGRCRPRPNDCEFLRLSEGEKRTFVYGEDGDRYTLKVTNIREVLVKPRKASAE